jgi:spore coat polysaccharide biosynthesis protein SpsF
MAANDMKIGIILLARLGSTRLPGKVLTKICHKTIIEHILDRLKSVSPCHHTIIATTIHPRDDVIAQLATSLGVDLFRGSEENVLERCIGAVESYKLDSIIRLGADNPFVDPSILNPMLKKFLKNPDTDYLSNTLVRTFPIGLDAEIFSKKTFYMVRDALPHMSKEERELNESCVIPYLHRNLEKFNTISFQGDSDHSDLRLTLDTPEDLILIKKIFNHLYPQRPDFGLTEILELLRENPDWSSINSKVIPLTGFWTPQEEEKLRLRYNQEPL